MKNVSWDTNLGGALIVLPAYLYNQQKKGEAKKDILTKIEQDRRDSVQRRNYDSSLLVMKLKFDTSNFKTNSIISENLGKYGYKFDSANNQIVKMIKDSSKKKVIVGDDPSLSLLGITAFSAVKDLERGDKFIKLKFDLLSAGVGSSSFNLTISAVGMGSDSVRKSMYAVYLWKNDEIFAATQRMSKDAVHGFYNFIERGGFTLIYFWLRGTYKNVDQTKTYNLDECYFYNIADNTKGSVKGDSKKTTVTFIKFKENIK